MPERRAGAPRGLSDHTRGEEAAALFTGPQPAEGVQCRPLLVWPGQETTVRFPLLSWLCALRVALGC